MCILSVSVVQFQCIAQVQDVEKEMDGNDDARNATFELKKVPEKKTETLKEKMTKTRGPEKILRTESLGTWKGQISGGDKSKGTSDGTHKGSKSADGDRGKGLGNR